MKETDKILGEILLIKKLLEFTFLLFVILLGWKRTLQQTVVYIFFSFFDNNK